MYRFERPDRVLLFGGTPLLGKFADWLVTQGIQVWAYTAPRQIGDLGSTGWTVNCTNDINTEKLPINSTTIGITFGPAWQFGSEIRAAFGHRLIDFMSIPYPKYLGGAHISWARLNEETEWGCCLQLVTENTEQGVCHDGAVISQASFPFVEQALENNYLTFLQQFIRACEHGATFESIPIDYNHATFYPRLSTDHNGWIDWSWGWSDVVTFANAFDDPYPGAQTTINGTEPVRIKGVELAWRGHHHPAMVGLIINHYPDEGYIVATHDGAVRIKDICCEQVYVGDRLFTSTARLDAARAFTATYDANGLCPK